LDSKIGSDPILECSSQIVLTQHADNLDAIAVSPVVDRVNAAYAATVAFPNVVDFPVPLRVGGQFLESMHEPFMIGSGSHSPKSLDAKKGDLKEVLFRSMREPVLRHFV
jgi:hypothetical protein